MTKYLLIAIEKSPLLTDAQLKVISDIGIATGQLAAATMILPFIVPEFDRAKLSMILSGLVISLGLWMASVLLVRRVK